MHRIGGILIGVFLLFLSGCARMEKVAPVVLIGDTPIFFAELRRDVEFQFFLENYVHRVILERAAISAEISQPNAEVVEKMFQQSISQQFESEAEFRDWLKERGLTEDDYRKWLRSQALTEMFLRKDLQPSDEEAKTAFQQSPDYWISLLSQQFRVPKEQITVDNPAVVKAIQDYLYFNNRSNRQKIQAIYEREKKRFPVDWNPTD